jgi:hypothetical protein
LCLAVPTEIGKNLEAIFHTKRTLNEFHITDLFNHKLLCEPLAQQLLDKRGIIITNFCKNKTWKMHLEKRFCTYQTCRTRKCFNGNLLEPKVSGQSLPLG